MNPGIIVRVLGYCSMVLIAVQQVLAENPIPTKKEEWADLAFKFFLSISAALSKGKNESNAPNPLPEPQSVTK